SETHDFEGAALLDENTILLSEEDTPSIHAYDLATGKKRFDLLIPKIFDRSNIVKNQGFESLTLAPDKQTLFTSPERALISDGNTKLIAEPFTSSTRCRIQQYARNAAPPGQARGFSPGSQFLYPTSGVHAFAGQIGLCDLVALDDHHLIALERSAAETLDRKPSIRTRIFYADTTSATDISNLPSLKDQHPTPVTKTLLFDNFIFDANGENLEGLCQGPTFSPTRRILLGVVDNTDGIHVSETRLAAFELLLPQNLPASQP
ncbi:MAG TPA: esterase-like activity of phytase family protein, partial [Tepidisphaeraceae bacterium]